MQNMYRFLKRYIDWIFIVIGCVAMALMFLRPNDCISSALLYITGITGCIYLCYAAYMWFFKRVDFDWHLINGHFLRKVIFVVISLPFTITFFMALSGADSSYPKKLIFDSHLYEQSIEKETRRIDTEANVRVNDSVSITGFTSHYTIESDKTLPDSIKEQHTDPHLFWTVYNHFIDPGNQHMSTTTEGRTLAALIAILGVLLLNGLLVSSIIGWVDSRKEKWQSGDIERYGLNHLGKYRFAVIIGANEIAASVIKSMFTPPKDGDINYKCEGVNDYVIVQTSRNPEDVRLELESHLTGKELERVIIYKALRDSTSELQYLHIEYSTEIYVLGESTLIDGGETYHDAMNMRCVNRIAEELEKSRSHREKERVKNGRSVKKVCKVMFEYQTTSSIFQFSDISDTIKRNIIFIPFNRYDLWAKAVIADNVAMEDCNASTGERLDYTPLDGNDGISEDNDNHVHFVIVGMSKMGIAMGVQAMLQAHYLNFAKAETIEEPDKREELRAYRRTRITFIDTNADKEMAFFKGRYENMFNLTRHRYIDASQCKEEDLKADSPFNWNDPMTVSGGEWSHLSEDEGNFIDLEIEFIKGEVESDKIRTYLRNITKKDDPWVMDSILTIAICLTQTHQAVAASLYMPVTVYEKTQEIWVYQRESADIVLNLTNSSQKDRRYKKLKPFGMLYGEYMNDRSQYLKALLVNGAYDLNGSIDGKEIKAVERDLTKQETYPDLRASWKALSIDKKYSNRYFADSIQLKIRSINAVGQPVKALGEAIARHSNTLAISEHNRWNIQQLILGYSPCHKQTDDEFEALNADYKAACEALDKWRESVGWKKLPKDKQAEFKANDKHCKELEEQKETAKRIFKEKKAFYKEGENRIHPNICAYSHLDKVDFEAKGYDTYLNSIIPTIKLLIDDRIETTNKNTDNA